MRAGGSCWRRAERNWVRLDGVGLANDAVAGVAADGRREECRRRPVRRASAWVCGCGVATADWGQSLSTRSFLRVQVDQGLGSDSSRSNAAVVARAVGCAGAAFALVDLDGVGSVGPGSCRGWRGRTCRPPKAASRLPTKKGRRCPRWHAAGEGVAGERDEAARTGEVLTVGAGRSHEPPTSVCRPTRWGTASSQPFEREGAGGRQEGREQP